jgi:cytochrome c
MNPALATLAVVFLLVGAAYAAEPDPGETMLRKCEICHTIEVGGRTKVGPNLHEIFGRKAGILPGFPYSDAMKASGIDWDDETMSKFLRDPRGFMPGNRMSFPGITDEAVLGDLLARLKQATQ